MAGGADTTIPIELDPNLMGQQLNEWVNKGLVKDPQAQRQKESEKGEETHAEGIHEGIHQESSRKRNKPTWMGLCNVKKSTNFTIVSYEFVLFFEFVFQFCLKKRGGNINTENSEL